MTERSSTSTRPKVCLSSELELDLWTDSSHLPVHASVASNTYAIYGAPQVKALTDMLPGQSHPPLHTSTETDRNFVAAAMPQLGPAEMGYLQMVASQMNASSAAAAGVEDVDGLFWLSSFRRL